MLRVEKEEDWAAEVVREGGIGFLSFWRWGEVVRRVRYVLLVKIQQERVVCKGRLRANMHESTRT